MIFLKTKAGFSYYLDVECSISVYFSLETSDLMIWQNFPVLMVFAVSMLNLFSCVLQNRISAQRRATRTSTFSNFTQPQKASLVITGCPLLCCSRVIQEKWIALEPSDAFF